MNVGYFIDTDTVTDPEEMTGFAPRSPSSFFACDPTYQLPAFSLKTCSTVGCGESTNRIT